MPTTEQRNQQGKKTTSGKPGRMANLKLLASALRFGGQLADLVDEDLATEIYGMADAPGFQATKTVADHDWYWIDASSKEAIARMATTLRAALEGALN